MLDKENFAGDDISFKKLFVPITNLKAMHIIAVIGIIVYFNAFFIPFLGDDKVQIVENQLVHSIFNFPSFFLGGTFAAGGGLAGIYYKPFLSLVFSGIYSLFGPNPFFFHFVQIVLHILNTSLLFVFFGTFLKKQYAFPLALIFLVHPLNAEAVIYISDLQDPLFFFFGITGLLLLLNRPISNMVLVAIQIFFLLSLFSKETGILFLMIAIIYLTLFQRTFLNRFILYSSFMLGIYAFFRFYLGEVYLNQDIISPIMQASLQERIFTIPSILFYYISTFFYPHTLLFSQQYVVKYIDFSSFYAPLIFIIFFLLLLMTIIFTIIRTSKKVMTPMIFLYSGFLLD